MHKSTQQSKKKKIVGMILCYNTAPMLKRALSRIPDGYFDEVYVMNDGSVDNIVEEAEKLGVKIFSHFPNRGYGGNIKAGIKVGLEMGADYIVELHGDAAQFDPSAIKAAIPNIERGDGLIIGSRFINPKLALENGMPLIRYVANRFLSFFDRIFLNLPLTEFHTGFKIYGKEFVNSVPYERNSDDYLFCFEIIAQASYYGIKTTEIPVEADYKAEHTSHKLTGATVYAISTFWVLFKHLCARKGLFNSAIFPKRGINALPLS